VKVALNKDC